MRETYGPDPDGLRYISAGVWVLFTALVFIVIAATVLWPHIVTETVAMITSCALIIAPIIAFCIVENKLRYNK